MSAIGESYAGELATICEPGRIKVAEAWEKLF
jgi:hypothetical protein